MSYMKRPCQHCPYRQDVKPFLHPDRGAELAYHAQNQYNDFPCHKTTEPDEDGEGMHATERSLGCAGFLTLQIAQGAPVPDGFTPAFDIVYADVDDMVYAYQDQGL